MSSRAFPPDFLWGTSTSAHQVEGGNDNNDWSEWEEIPGRIHDGTRAGRACAWWAGMAEEDLAVAARLGQNAHRLGCNPGGEVQGLEIMPSIDASIGDDWRGRLLTKAACEDLDRQLKAMGKAVS